MAINETIVPLTQANPDEFQVTEAIAQLQRIIVGLSQQIEELQGGGGGGDFSGSYEDLTDVPVSFPPSPHTHIWEEITDKPAFSTVAISGQYSDLTGLPTLFSGDYEDLTNKPTLFDGQYSSLSGIPSTFTPAPHSHTYDDLPISSTQVANWDTAFTWGDHAQAGYLTSVSWTEVTGKPNFATVATSGSYTDLSDVPSTFPPAAHTHDSLYVKKTSDTTYSNVGTSTGDEAVFTSFLQSGSNASRLIIKDVRIDDSSGDWTTVGTRIQKRIDSVDMGFIEFNGLAGTYNVGIGSLDPNGSGNQIVNFAFRRDGNLDVTNGGIQIGAPTGGRKGLGTINATGIFENNNAVVVDGTNQDVGGIKRFTTGIIQVGSSGGVSRQFRYDGYISSDLGATWNILWNNANLPHYNTYGLSTVNLPSATLNTANTGFYDAVSGANGRIVVSRDSSRGGYIEIAEGSSPNLHVYAEHYNPSTGASFTGKQELWHTQNLAQPMTLNTNQTVSGVKTYESEIIQSSPSQLNKLRFVNSNNPYGTFWRYDNNTLYLMFTNSGDQLGNWSNQRPLAISPSNGSVLINGGSGNTSGVQVGNPTGGHLAPGTLNAQGLYKNGVELNPISQGYTELRPSNSAWANNIEFDLQRQGKFVVCRFRCYCNTGSPSGNQSFSSLIPAGYRPHTSSGYFRIPGTNDVEDSISLIVSSSGTVVLEPTTTTTMRTYSTIVCWILP